MKFYGILIAIFGIIIIVFPEIIAYLVGGFLIFAGLNMLFIGFYFQKRTKGSKENYVKFGKYKIYR